MHDDAIGNLLAFAGNHPISMLGVVIFVAGWIGSASITPPMPSDPGDGFIDPSDNAAWHQTMDQRIAGHRVGTRSGVVCLVLFALDAFLSFQ